jgi:hypothetical protein
MFSETSVDYQRTTQRYVLENRALSKKDLAITMYSKSFLSVVPVITSPLIPEFKKMIEKECMHHLRISVWFYNPFVGPWPLFQFLNPTHSRCWPPLWSSGQSSWLQIQRFRVRVLALHDFLRSSGSVTGSTQPREDN